MRAAPAQLELLNAPSMGGAFEIGRAWRTQNLVALALRDDLTSTVDANRCHAPTISQTWLDQVIHRLARHAQLRGCGTIIAQIHHKLSRPLSEVLSLSKFWRS